MKIEQGIYSQPFQNTCILQSGCSHHKYCIRRHRITAYSSQPSTSYPGSSLFLPRESTLVSAGHVSPFSKQLPTRVDTLFFKKRRESECKSFQTRTNTEEWKSLAHFFSKTGTLKKSTVYYLRRFRTTNNADFKSTKYFMVGSICFEFAEGV